MNGRCELFSKLIGGNIVCEYPKESGCGFQFYTNIEGKTLSMCKYRKDKMGFKKCWEEMEILLKWAKIHKLSEEVDI